MFLVPGELPDDFLPNILPSVERSTSAGRDANGRPVVAWTAVAGYVNFPALVVPGGYQEYREWEQRDIEATHKAYIGPLPGVGLPLLTLRDRLPYRGAHYLVKGWKDWQGVVLEVDALEVRPGETG